MTPLSQATGLIVLLAYGLACFALAWALHRRFQCPGHSEAERKAEFLVAGRRVGAWAGAMSIAATWIWAPALFISSQKAYTQGLAGVFWFTAPNIACLVLFAFFAKRVRKILPNGFTLSELMRSLYSQRVHRLYLAQMGGLAVCSFAVQLLAGGKALAYVFGLPFLPVTLLLAAMALSYSLWSGLRASVGTDVAQMGLILLVAGGIIWAVQGELGGFGTILQGLGGVGGQFHSLTSADGLDVALHFGVPVTIGLLAGPFGDQSFWQRAFALKERSVMPAFVGGALLFGLVPMALSLLGFAAAGLQLEVADTGLVNVALVEKLLPAWALIPLVVMLLSGLASTLDSNLCAIAGLVGHDLNNSDSLRGARWSMAFLAVAAVGIANIPGMKILYLFLFYGTLRAATLLPTLVTLSFGPMQEKAVFFGVLTAIAVGLPVFAYGNFSGEFAFTLGGSLLTVLAPGAWMAVATVSRIRSRPGASTG